MTRVTCNLRQGHTQLIDMLNGVYGVNMCNMGVFQPRDLDDVFLRRCVANGCRDVTFPEGNGPASQITDEAIFEFCFGTDPYNRPQRFLTIEEPALSATFVRDFVRVSILAIVVCRKIMRSFA